MHESSIGNIEYNFDSILNEVVNLFTLIISFQGLDCVAVAGLGKEEIKEDEIEFIDNGKENIRLGIGGLSL